jgi:hypothetical protein
MAPEHDEGGQLLDTFDKILKVADTMRSATCEPPMVFVDRISPGFSETR